LAAELGEAFREEDYTLVKEIGAKKKQLEDQLVNFEAKYKEDKQQITGVRAEIEEIAKKIQEAYTDEDYERIKVLGDKKKELQASLEEMEANFGLANEQYFKVGDKVQLCGLQTPRGTAMNGTPGVIREYMPKEKRYKIEIPIDPDDATLNGMASPKVISPRTYSLTGPSDEARRSSMIAVQPKNIKKRENYEKIEGVIKLWFPKKHFGFITPDEKKPDSKDIFFHGSHVLNSKDMQIRRFSRVDFRIIPAPKGDQARDVKILSHPTQEQELYGHQRKTMGQFGSPGAPNSSSAGPEVYISNTIHKDHIQTGPIPPVNVRPDPLPDKSLIEQPTEFTRWASVNSNIGIDFSGQPLKSPTGGN